MTDRYWLFGKIRGHMEAARSSRKIAYGGIRSENRALPPVGGPLNPTSIIPHLAALVKCFFIKKCTKKTGGVTTSLGQGHPACSGLLLLPRRVHHHTRKGRGRGHLSGSGNEDNLHPRPATSSHKGHHCIWALFLSSVSFCSWVAGS